MKIVFDDDAIEDLRGIRAWIAKSSPRAAAELLRKIFHKIDNLQAPELTYMVGRVSITEPTS